MPVIAGFFGSDARAALPGHGAAFIRYFKKLARFTKLAISYMITSILSYPHVLIRHLL